MMSLALTAAATLFLQQSVTTDVFTFEGDSPFDKDVKMYRYTGSLADADPERTIVCREVYELHSKMPSKVCRILTKWEDIYESNQSELAQKRRSKRSGSSGSPPSETGSN